jgi:hypothetical protein
MDDTTKAAAASTQTRDGEEAAAGAADLPITGDRFCIGPRVLRACLAQAYEREPNDPLYRPLRIFALDPASSRLDGAVATVNVPYEPLARGPVGRLFAIDSFDPAQDARYRRADLEDQFVLMSNGRSPSPSDPEFHQQMVYAICSLVYASFRTALGRQIAWGFSRGDTAEAKEGQLLVRPFGLEGRNAYYEKETGELRFGYFRAPESVGGMNLPGGYIFTSLSHDIVAHEVTHALLDGLRAHFIYPSGPDVLAFHESFADLVAVFQRFSYRDVVRRAVQRSRGNVGRAAMLTDIARQFGQTRDSSDTQHALRTVIDTGVGPDGKPVEPMRLDPKTLEPHARGSVLTSAVFDAFLTLFQRKTERYLKLATNGTGVLPEGDLSDALLEALANEASQIASQFLTVLIRSIDYCPPVDLEFGEYLRAILTADHDVVADDPWGYREAFIQAFARRGIYPGGVDSLAEDALLWRAPSANLPPQTELAFGSLKFDGDPGRPAGYDELTRQGRALGAFVAQPENLYYFGLAAEDDPARGDDTLEPPVVESIRSSRRAGPDGQVVFDLVAEVTQRRIVRSRDQPDMVFYGGATIILSPRGEVRYVISKSVLNDGRIERQRAFVTSEAGRRLWATDDDRVEPRAGLLRLVHDED